MVIKEEIIKSTSDVILHVRAVGECQNQAVEFTLTFFQNLEIALSGLRILSVLILYVVADC